MSNTKRTFLKCISPEQNRFVHPSLRTNISQQQNGNSKYINSKRNQNNNQIQLISTTERSQNLSSSYIGKDNNDPKDRINQFHKILTESLHKQLINMDSKKKKKYFIDSNKSPKNQNTKIQPKPITNLKLNGSLIMNKVNDSPKFDNNCFHSPLLSTLIAKNRYSPHSPNEKKSQPISTLNSIQKQNENSQLDSIYQKVKDKLDSFSTQKQQWKEEKLKMIQQMRQMEVEIQSLKKQLQQSPGELLNQSFGCQEII